MKPSYLDLDAQPKFTASWETIGVSMSSTPSVSKSARMRTSALFTVSATTFGLQSRALPFVTLLLKRLLDPSRNWPLFTVTVCPPRSQFAPEKRTAFTVTSASSVVSLAMQTLSSAVAPEKLVSMELCGISRTTPSASIVQSDLP